MSEAGLRRAYDNGCAAAVAGYQFTVNPYVPNDPLELPMHIAWLNGYNSFTDKKDAAPVPSPSP